MIYFIIFINLQFITCFKSYFIQLVDFIFIFIINLMLIICFIIYFILLEAIIITLINFN